MTTTNECSTCSPPCQLEDTPAGRTELTRPAITLPQELLDEVAQLTEQARELLPAVVELAKSTWWAIYRLDDELAGQTPADGDFDFAWAASRGKELTNLVSVLGGHLVSATEGVPTGDPRWLKEAHLEWALAHPRERHELLLEWVEKVEANGPAPLDKLRAAASVADERATLLAYYVRQARDGGHDEEEITEAIEPWLNDVGTSYKEVG